MSADDKIRIAHLQRENADLNAMLKSVNVDALIATQLRRSIERNSRLVIMLQEVVADYEHLRRIGFPSDDFMIKRIRAVLAGEDVGPWPFTEGAHDEQSSQRTDPRHPDPEADGKSSD